jgi:hypothetical protein
MSAVASAIDSTINFVEDQYLFLRKGLALRLLESELAQIVRTVSSHKRNKVPQGSSQYQSLWRRADQLVDSFCSTYQVDRSEIEAQLPALTEMRNLSVPPAQRNKKLALLFSVVGVFVLTIMTGFVAGVFHWVFSVGWQAWHSIETFLKIL